MKIQIPVFCLLLCLVLVSCATTNPFGDDNPYVYGIGDRGQYVFTTTDRGTAQVFANLEVLDYSRVTGCFDPATGFMYGAIEGSFGKTAVNTALGLSGQFEKNRSGITYWTHKESGMQVFVPANGIVLFASEDIESVYDTTYLNPSRGTDTILADRILGASTGVYVSSPLLMPDLGFNIADAAMERFDFILLISDGIKYDVLFGLTDSSFADSFLTLLRSAYVGALREAGKKVDTSYLRQIILKDGTTVYLKDQDYTYELVPSILH